MYVCLKYLWKYLIYIRRTTLQLQLLRYQLWRHKKLQLRCCRLLG